LLGPNHLLDQPPSGPDPDQVPHFGQTFGWRLPRGRNAQTTCPLGRSRSLIRPVISPLRLITRQRIQVAPVCRCVGMSAITTC
jgi:hypothetical protein